MKLLKLLSKIRLLSLVSILILTSAITNAQTNVYDDVIAMSSDHTSLTAAIAAAGLESALQDNAGTYTVFAPDNTAFNNLAVELGTDIPGLLALPNLSDILLYHVLGTSVAAADINNGDIVTPLNNANTIKLTKTTAGMVYANQAMVNAADLTADNGIVHSINAVILPSETVADVAIDNGFSSLTTAVVTAELLPALTNPFADFTVFAPDNAAFNNLAVALGTDINGLLALPNLSDILLYHVLGTSVASGDINNGDIVTPLNNANTIKLTATTSGMVYANQAMVTLADVMADNGVVHAVNAVILPNETVADIAIDNAFTILTTAVITAELLPALTDPFANFTVFAPSDGAFITLADALGTDINGLLALPNLSDILLYHVLGTSVAAADINNGDIVTPLNNANTIKLTATTSGMVYANQAMVLIADVTADNGVVHVVDSVILPNETVADIAIDNSFSILTTAVITAELLPALTDPLANLTVFAPSDGAFISLADALGTDINGLLALPNLSDILLYHVLGNSVAAADISNGDIVTPLNSANTIKLTATSSGIVYANQAKVLLADVTADNGIVHAVDAVILPNETVVDIAIDNGFSALTTAVATAELLPALTDPFADFTVFAPSDDAFVNLADALGTDINGLLALPNLSDILLYHVLGNSVAAADINNGDIVTPLNNANTIKLTATTSGMVYANQAMVLLADVTADNGIVHAVDTVILPSETVVDIAIDNGFSALTTAVVTAELLPALTDPFADFTVFAPSDDAFVNLADALDTDINGLLALPNLSDILLYHVLGNSVAATDINNGDIVTPLNSANTIKLTATTGGMVYANQAMVTLADVTADNGIVHAVDAVILPSETVVDIAIDNAFTSLTQAVITAELLPALTDPLASYTVFAPTDAAFTDLATALGTDLNGILALPNLANILLYHVVSGETLSSDLENGALMTLNGEDVQVDLSSGVMINTATVILADVMADNGVVHVIDEVLVPAGTASVTEFESTEINVYPNPSADFVNIKSTDGSINKITLLSLEGKIIFNSEINSNQTSIDLGTYSPGQYILRIEKNASIITKKLLKI